MYIALLLLRIIVSTSCQSGYIHPDEFFQGGQELLYGCSIPWEFQPSNAIRSIIPPTLMTQIPLWLYSSLGGGASGLEILKIPRLFLSVVSIATVDLCVYQLTPTTKRVSSKGRRRVVSPQLWSLATSWPVWVFLGRPFTNTLETMVLSLLLFVVLKRQRRSSGGEEYHWTVAFGIGELCALGVFTRFTFVFFAFPIIWYWLRETIYSSRLIFTNLFCFLLGGLLASFLIVLADAGYYQRQNQLNNSNHDSGHLTLLDYITPWNAFKYNSHTSNLRDHGLHPRFTHATINMALLFGPCMILYYLRLLLSSSLSKQKARRRGNRRRAGVSDDIVCKLCLACATSGLVVLSLAPHQEPRFLLPMVVPLVIALGKFLWHPRLRATWIVFNLVMGIVFGVWHQGGVIPSLLELGGDAHFDGKTIYYHTYMPPSFLLRKDGNADGCRSSNLIDLKGGTTETLLAKLDQLLQCGGDHNPTSAVRLVSPPLHLTGGVRISEHQCRIPRVTCIHRKRFSNKHLTTEDLPLWSPSPQLLWENLSLSMYEINCRQ